MNFFSGTYGFDSLSMFLLLLSIIFNIGDFTRIISLLLTFFVFYRAFSKNTYKRNMELNKFLGLLNRFSPKFAQNISRVFPRTSLDVIPLLFQNFKRYLAQKREFKIVKCPKCGQKLRLPRGKGKILVTCKKCLHEFRLKT